VHESFGGSGEDDFMAVPTANQLLAYFERTNREHPDQHWLNGAELCRRWLALQPQESVSQSEVDECLARLESEPNEGSAWFDLRIQFRRWARLHGFRA
jgi:hypothetical protein